MSSQKRRSSRRPRLGGRLLARSSNPTLTTAITAAVAVVVAGLVVFYAASHAATSWVPVFSTNFPDPWVLNYNNEYYAYATNQTDLQGATSTDGINWTPDPNPVLSTYPSWAVGGATWAPTVVYNVNTKRFVMFYAVLDQQMSPKKHCIGRASSASPTGPFVDDSTQPFLCQPTLGGTNDPGIFVDSDGQAYLYVKNAGDAIGVKDHLWVQPLTSNFRATGTLTEVLSRDQTWQGRTMEGPGMVKLGGEYFLFYAGNYFDSSHYAIGYATCTSPLGPCTEGPSNPVIASQGSMLGPGSPAFYIDTSGQQKMVFAAWYNAVNNYRAMYEATLTLQNGTPVITPVP